MDQDPEHTPTRRGINITNIPFRIVPQKKKKPIQKELTPEEEFNLIIKNLEELKEEEKKKISDIKNLLTFIISLEKDMTTQIKNKNKSSTNLNKGNFEYYFLFNIHFKVIENNLLNKYEPELINMLKETYFYKDTENYFEKFISKHDKKTKSFYVKYIKTIIEPVILETISGLFKELYEIFENYNIIFNDLITFYQESNKSIREKYDINNYLYYMVTPLDITDFFKNFFLFVDRTLRIYDLGEGTIFYMYYHRLKTIILIPFQKRLEQVIRDQESKRQDLERLNRKNNSMAEFRQFQNKLNEDIERQFKEDTFQEPESQFLKFKSLMDPRFKKIPEVPDEFKDPISLEIMTDPVVASDGNTYERHTIETWIIENTTSPLTGLQLRSFELYPNLYLKKLIEDFKDEYHDFNY